MDMEAEVTRKKGEKAQQLEQYNDKLVKNIQNLDDGSTKNPHLTVKFPSILSKFSI